MVLCLLVLFWCGRVTESLIQVFFFKTFRILAFNYYWIVIKIIYHKHQSKWKEALEVIWKISPFPGLPRTITLTGPLGYVLTPFHFSQPEPTLRRPVKPHTHVSELAKWWLSWQSRRPPTPCRSTQMWLPWGWPERKKMRFPTHLLTFHEAQYLSWRFLRIVDIELQCPDDPGLGSCSGQWPHYPTLGWCLEHIPSSASQLAIMLFTIFFPVSQPWLLKPRGWAGKILEDQGEASFLPHQANYSKW